MPESGNFVLERVELGNFAHLGQPSYISAKEYTIYITKVAFEQDVSYLNDPILLLRLIIESNLVEIGPK